MISGHKISARHVDYYLDYVRSGGPSRWVGEAAVDLGLSGPVDPDDFSALAAGAAPGGGRLLERVRADHTPGWDFTFSCPKSVSVCWALADGDLRRALEAAHEHAVDAAVGYLQDHGGRSRRGLGGRDGHVGAGLAVACFGHPASRESDPQLHTHAIVLNVGHGEDRRWTSIDSRTLYAHRRAAGAIYRAELRSRVAALGGVWSAPDRRGLSELAGMDAELLTSFSRRRNQIEAALAESGTAGRAAAQAACLATRRAKLDVELADLASEWAERAGARGWDARRVAGLLDGTDRRVDLTGEERHRVEEAMLSRGGLTAEAAAFVRDDVVVSWVGALPQGGTRAEVESLAGATLSRPEIVPLVVAGADGHPLTTDDPHSRGLVRLVRSPSGTGTLVAERRYSTADMLATEARLFATALAGQGVGAGMVQAEAVNAVLGARGHLSAEQAEMVRGICTSGNLVDVVVGVPGSGKTFALEAARRAWEAAGYEVIGTALAAEAAAQLQAGSGIASATLDSTLGRLERGERRLSLGTIIVIDESGMVDTRRLARIVEYAAATGTKVVLTGDDRQLPAVEAGGAFAALADRLGAQRLSDNGRQVLAWEREALAALREGRAGEAVGAYRRAGRVHEATDPGVLLSMMVTRWWAARSDGEEAALFAYSRDAARVLNALARQRLADAGQLGGDELVVPEHGPTDLAPRSYRAGDEIVCLRNRARLGADRDPSGVGVRNGTRGVVRVVDQTAGEVTVEDTDGRRVVLPADYLVAHTDYGYAWTLHKGQGRTLGQSARAEVDPEQRRRGRAFIYGAEVLSAEAALVAASRATDSTEMFVLVEPEPEAEETDPLAVYWARSGAKTTATGELETQARIAALATEPVDKERLAQRAALGVLIGTGPRADLPGAAESARQRIGLAAVSLDAVFNQARDETYEPEPRTTEWHRAMTELRSEVESEAVAAMEEADHVEGRLARQAEVRARLGADLHRAWEEIETVDSALATRRDRHLAGVGSEPPDYVVGLLGPAPQDRARSLRWRQGLAEIEDFRRKHSFQAAPDERVGPWTAALGVAPEDWWQGRSYRKAAESLRLVRRDLGLDRDDLLPVAEVSGGAAGVLGRPAPLPTRSPSSAGPARSRGVRR